jgi:nucleoside-diphosphate-sugar epimerase
MLVERNAEVLATLSALDRSETYAGIRADRISRLKRLCRTRFGAPFGSPEFLEAVAGEARIDVVCHHWSRVENYKSPDFDPISAAADNTHGLRDILRILKDKGCSRIVVTGSVGEPDEGAGSRPASAFSPYALSKRLSYEIFRYYCGREGVTLDKFVIPNPFGPFEEARFTHYLMTNWFAGRSATVLTPAYVRDNIHVDLLAKAYAQFVLHARSNQATASMPARLAPSGYVETQGAFAERVAREVGCRLQIACPLEHSRQQEFAEPAIRINTDVPDFTFLGWDECAAWDSFVNYYCECFGN